MKKSDNLLNILSNLSGKILCIGINEEKYLNKIDSNDNIVTCHLMNLNGIRSKNNTLFFKRKTVNIRKIRKKFKKKRLDYIVCNINDIKEYLRNFIKDSVYICKNEIYFYGEIDDVECKQINSKYNRYDVVIENLDDNKNKIIKIDVSRAKNNKFKDFIYSVIDLKDLIIDVIVNILIN